MKIFKKALFNLKYKLGKAEEGKDFYSCGGYEFCSSCTELNKPCSKNFKI
ncbi:MAG: hypothetical protein K0R54_523 [Clostridiaceae bacterium]|jgi:hypothetical protein|nr:hypothetical protein [Clostridiaceae bacterium]